MQALERRPWTLAVLAGAGVALLVCGATALLAPPDLLDAAVAAGDQKLWLGLAALFVAATLISRVAVHRRRSPEDEVVADAPEPPPPGDAGAHLR